MEIWKDIKGYEGLYAISTLGRVKSLKRDVKRGAGVMKVSEKILKNILDTEKRPNIILWKGNKRKQFIVSRLVAQTFIGPVDGLYVCHKDDDPKNNNVDNLFIGTQKDNIKDCIDKGRFNFVNPGLGANNGNSKLTKTKVKLIKLMISMGEKTRVIAEHFGVSMRNIFLIKSLKTWKHVSI